MSAGRMTDLPRVPKALPRRRWLRFSLRGLLLLITVFGVWLGIKVDQARRQKRAVDTLRALGAEIAYEHQRVKNGFDPKIELAVPAWARELCGDDFFQTVKAVWFWGKHSDDKTKLVPYEITDDDLRCLADLPHVERLSIDSAPITDAGLAHLAHPERLTEVILYNTNVGDGFVRRLKGAQHLEALTLENSKVTDEGLAELRGTLTLTVLRLGGTRTGDRALASFTGCEGLVILETGSLTTDAGLRQFKAFPNLDTLRADDGPMTGEAFRGLRFPKAEMVAVRHCAIGDDDLPPLVDAVRDVRVLVLTGNAITDSGLRHLSHLGSTEIIMLTENKLRGRELSHLRSLRGIAWINLRGCPLDDPDLKSLQPLYTGTAPGMHLSLDNTPIGDDDLAKISGFANLTHLTLSHTKISDDGLPHLYALGKLAVLDLRGTRVTAGAVYQLKQTVGGVTVAWDEDPQPAGWPW